MQWLSLCWKNNCQAIEVVKRGGKPILMKINCVYVGAPDWWTANNKKVGEGYFLSETGDCFIRVKYIDGYLHYFESRT